MTGTATTFDALVTKSTANVRKALKGGVLIAPISTALPASLTIDSPTTPGTPVLQTLTGFVSLGYIADGGAVFTENIQSADVQAWGLLEPVRRDITSDVTELKVTALESNKETLATYYQIDPASLTPDATTAELQIPKQVSPVAIYYRVLVISQDGAAGSEYWIARMMPRASITGLDNISLDSAKDPISYGMTFTAYTDPVAGYAVMTYYAGPAWKTNKTGAGF